MTSFPAYPEVKAAQEHPQSNTILTHLKDTYPVAYSKLQGKLASYALSMIDTGTVSKSVIINPQSIGVKSILCHRPCGGTKVLRFYRINSTPTPCWSAPFTGTEWRLDLRTLDGKNGVKEVFLDSKDDLIVDMHQQISKMEDGRVLTDITVTNITSISNIHKNIVFGANKRPLSIPHIIATHINPGFVKDKISEKDMDYIKNNSAELASNIVCNGIMPLDSILKMDDLLEPKCDKKEKDDFPGPGGVDMGFGVADLMVQRIVKKIPNLADNIRVYPTDSFIPPDMQERPSRGHLTGIAIIIQSEEMEQESWVKNYDTWNGLLEIIAEECALTLV